MPQISSLFLAIFCAIIAYAFGWSDETLDWLSLPLMSGYVIGEVVM